MKAGYDFILVSIEEELASKLKYKSLELVGDPERDPTAHVTTFGLVVATPIKLKRWKDKVHEVVKVGDIAYWDYTAINRDDDDRKIKVGDEEFFRIPYNQIQCVVRGGEIIVMSGRALCEPILDEEVEEVDGGVVRNKKSGLIIWRDKTHDLRFALVSHMGPPIIGEPDLELSPGEKVYYHPFADAKYTIEGKEYFVMHQQDLYLRA